MCTVNPYLGAPGDQVRRAMPLLRGELRPAPRRVAIVGGGPGGLEAALTLQAEAGWRWSSSSGAKSSAVATL